MQLYHVGWINVQSRAESGLPTLEVGLSAFNDRMQQCKEEDLVVTSHSYEEGVWTARQLGFQGVPSIAPATSYRPHSHLAGQR